MASVYIYCKCLSWERNDRFVKGGGGVSFSGIYGMSLSAMGQGTKGRGKIASPFQKSWGWSVRPPPPHPPRWYAPAGAYTKLWEKSKTIYYLQFNWEKRLYPHPLLALPFQISTVLHSIYSAPKNEGGGWIDISGTCIRDISERRGRGNLGFHFSHNTDLV